MGMYATLYAIDVLFDYTYNLILRTRQSPISSDNQLSTEIDACREPFKF